MAEPKVDGALEDPRDRRLHFSSRAYLNEVVGSPKDPRVSWSATTTEFPSAISSRMIDRTYRHDVGGGAGRCRLVEDVEDTGRPVALRTARASYARWRSPLDSVEDARSRTE